MVAYNLAQLEEEYPLVYEAAMFNIKDQGRSEQIQENSTVGNSFTWSDTEEKGVFWGDINIGNYKRAGEKLPHLFLLTKKVIKHKDYEEVKNGLW